MKTTVSKQEVMKAAWANYRKSCSGMDFDRRSFAVCLKMAWATAKVQAERAAELARAIERHAKVEIPTLDEAIGNWYANAPRGTYFGD